MRDARRLPQAPGKVNPYNNPEAAIERRNYVIGRMVANGYVDKPRRQGDG
jgi:penicillin-binding protein 1A